MTTPLAGDPSSTPATPLSATSAPQSAPPEPSTPVAPASAFSSAAKPSATPRSPFGAAPGSGTGSGTGSPSGSSSGSPVPSQPPVSAPNASEPEPTTVRDRYVKTLQRVDISYAEALKEAGVISESDLTAIKSALEKSAPTTLADSPNPVLDKLTLGRGESERQSAALRLWLLDEMTALSETGGKLQKALVEQAESHVATLMPGYVNFQPRQVISGAQWLLSYFWALARDQERLTESLGRTSISPLGSDLLAGSPYRMDRKAMASELGFSRVSENSIDATTDADFAAEFLFVTALISAHMERFVSELAFFLNPTLGFLTLNGEIPASTDALQLMGDLSAVLALIRGIPALQLGDKQLIANLMFAAESTAKMLERLTKVINTLEFHPDRMYDALTDSLLTGELVDYLTTKGATVKDAQTAVQQAIARADHKNKALADLELADYKQINPLFEADLFSLFDFSRSVAQRGGIGGAAPVAVRSQIRGALNWLVEAGLA